MSSEGQSRPQVATAPRDSPNITMDPHVTGIKVEATSGSAIVAKVTIGKRTIPWKPII